MGLEVRLELAGYCNQSEGELLYRWVPLFYTMECPTGVVHGLYTLSSSLTKATLTAAGDTARKRNNFSPGLEGLSNDGEERCLQIL